MACKKCGKKKCACKKVPVYKKCKNCPSPAKCKRAGKCMGKK